MRRRLVTFRDENGRELFDLPDAPRPDPETPAPPRFFPDYDNIFLGHADRNRIVSDERRQAMILTNFYAPALLVDGFGRGFWRLTQTQDAATLLIEQLEPFTEQEEAEVIEEGQRLLEFAAPDAAQREVHFGRLNPAGPAVPTST